MQPASFITDLSVRLKLKAAYVSCTAPSWDGTSNNYDYYAGNILLFQCIYDMSYMRQKQSWSILRKSRTYFEFQMHIL